MAESNLCRLCVAFCNESKSLYDENGQANELCDIVINYFHPRILNMEDAKHITVICLPCWRFVGDFHSFQESVMVAQLKLFEGDERETEALTPNINSQDDYEKEVGLKDDSEELLQTIQGPTVTEKGNRGKSYSEPRPKRAKGPSTSALGKYDKENIPAPVDTLVVEAKNIQNIIDLDTDVDFSSDSEYNAKLPSNIKCVECPESYPELCLLQDHFRQQHSEKKFYISCCSLNFSKLNTIKSHLLLHSDTEAFNCAICGRNFKSNPSLRQHVSEAHHEDQENDCTLCGKGFSTPRGLKCHYISIHKTATPSANLSIQSGHTCTECGKTKHSKAALAQHKFYHHRYEPKHPCSICGRRLNNLRDVREHLAINHHHRDLYECAYCPATFNRMSTLIAHRKGKHPQESNKKFYNMIDQDTGDATKTGARSRPRRTTDKL